MDFHSVMETFAEAWVAANTHTPLTVAAEQGLINGPANHTSPNRPIPVLPVSNQGPTNHTPPNRPIPVLPVSNQGPPIHSPLNHHPVNSNISTNGAVSNNVPPPSPPAVVTTLSQTTVDISQPLLSQDATNDRRDIETSSEGECCKVPERSSDDSPSNGSNIGDMKPYSVNLSKPQGKSLPVHCIVEQIPGPQACGQHVELDSYAIVPADTLFNDLVRTALGKLGYSTAQILGAKGSIQIKKWKSLAFDQITENAEATVADILGELTTVASLHVRLYSVPDDPREWKDITVRNAVLELLREMSQSKLAKLCPLSQPMLSNIINNRYMGKIGKEKCQEFGLWYLNYRKQNPEGSTPEVVPSDRPVDGRLTFHPTKELPLMRGWFHSCRNPSRRTLQLYVDILNQGPVRQQERPKIALSTLKNWWKNEKQRERKHQRDDDKVDEPAKPKKKRKSEMSTKTEHEKNRLAEGNLPNSDSTSELKSNNFTMINHSENESDAERCDKKDGDVPESQDISKLNSTEINKTNSNLSIINYTESSGEVNKFMPKDFPLSDHRLNSGILHSPKASSDSNIFPKICMDHHHTLFPFSDPHLNVHNCTKVYCDNNMVGRTHLHPEGCSTISSEDDVDVGI